MSDRTPMYDLAVAAGAVLVEEAGWEIPGHYGNAQAEYRRACEQAAFFDVSHRGLIEVTGPEAASFLQNLCTGDIKALAVGDGCEAFFTTAKAKIIVRALVSRVEEKRFSLDVDPGMGDKLLKHLDHFLISEQLELADRTRDHVHLYLAGPQARMVLEKAIGTEIPELPLHHRTSGDLLLRRHDPLGVPGYDLLCPSSQAESLWQGLTAAGAGPAGTQVYEILRVEAGTPRTGAEIDEDRFVMELGRSAAICYTKGCYLGQEPIVMARDRGQVNRTLLGLKISGSEPVARGASVLKDTTAVGQVTSSVVSPRVGSSIALAYIRRGSQTPGTKLEIDTPGGRRTAELVGLPFIS